MDYPKEIIVKGTPYEFGGFCKGASRTFAKKDVTIFSHSGRWEYSKNPNPMPFNFPELVSADSNDSPVYINLAFEEERETKYTLTAIRLADARTQVILPDNDNARLFEPFLEWLISELGRLDQIISSPQTTLDVLNEIPDIGWNREGVRLWNEDVPASQIALRFKISEQRVFDVISALRKDFPLLIKRRKRTRKHYKQ